MIRRFKTEEEFIKEFGANWTAKVENTWHILMNPFFGQAYEGPINKWTKIGGSHDSFKISDDMLTDKLLPTKPFNIDDYEGKYFKAHIQGKPCEGRIWISPSPHYLRLCTNEEHGDGRNNTTYGYKYGWNVSKKEFKNLLDTTKHSLVTSFSIVDRPEVIAASKHFNPGDIVEALPGCSRALYAGNHYEVEISGKTHTWLKDPNLRGISFHNEDFKLVRAAIIIASKKELESKEHEFKVGDVVTALQDLADIFMGQICKVAVVKGAYLELEGKPRSGYLNKYFELAETKENKSIKQPKTKTKNNGKQDHTNSNNGIEIRRQISQITVSERQPGQGISSRRSRATVTVGHLKHKEVTCR